MGLRGTDVAVEAADAVLLKDDLRKVALLLYLAKRTRTAIYMNLVIALVFAGVMELVAAAGFFGIVSPGLQPIAAAVAHILGVMVIAVNSVRLAGGGPATVSSVQSAVSSETGEKAAVIAEPFKMRTVMSVE